MAISILPMHLVNKIAAGEVIERPASIVKELVENSLDAGAARIDVVLEDGGKKLIAVTDDGCGMGAEDLALAFRPHATSKISTADDLFRIGTMGFRGEALASIASVSHAHIRSRPADDDSGHELDASGETVGQVRPCGASAGTTVAVRDLFFNTPARRKFMRTAATELAHATEAITRLAMPHPRTAFTLAHNSRQVYNLPAATTTVQRAADLFGPDLAGTLIPLVQRGGGAVGINGLVAPPAAARASAKWQYFFVNGRYVRDRLLGHALREAYRGLVDPSRWPVALLFIEIDPAEVDVNVHPTKVEVRFRDGQLVHGELLAALKETLNRADLAPTAALQDADARPSADDRQRRHSVQQALADFFKSAPPTQPRFSFPEGLPSQGGRRMSEGWAGQRGPERLSPAGPPDRAQPARTPSPDSHANDDRRPHANDADGPWTRAGGPAPEATGDLRQIGQAGGIAGEGPPPAPSGAVQIHNTYIIAPEPDGFAIVDQHALHERLIYNDLKRRLAGPDAPGLTAQRMLIPQPLSATASEAAMLQTHRALLARLGIETVPFGPDSVAVQQFPSLLAERGVQPAEFLREILDRLADDETAEAEGLLESVLEMMACKAAVKAGDPLTAPEIDALLAGRHEADKASACPHGRPTSLKLTLKELQKQFRRT